MLFKINREAGRGSARRCSSHCLVWLQMLLFPPPFLRISNKSGIITVMSLSSWIIHEQNELLFIQIEAIISCLLAWGHV